ncbi:MAG: hypothetical protein ACKV2T_05285 [Kofleriaceae bacterium]
MKSLLIVVIAIVGAGRVLAAPLADPFVQVAAGTSTCAVRASGTVSCFSGDDPVLRTVPGVAGATQVAVHHSRAVCAVLRDGTVRCVDLEPSRNTVVSPPITNASAIVFDSSDDEMCVRVTTGPPVCFDPFEIKPPTASGFPATTTQFAFGDVHECALLADGRVRCRGSNGRGQLGTGASVGMRGGDDIAPSGPPGGVFAHVTGAIAVAAANEHTCAIVRGGVVKCWGTHYQGALGQGEKRIEPGTIVTVPGITNAVEIEAAAWSTCARTRDGGVYCWGTNSDGQLGDKALTDRASPIKLSIGKATDLSLTDGFTCATLADGNVTCLGGLYSSVPVKVPRLANVVSIVADRDATCAITKDDATWCWGRLGGIVAPRSIGGLAIPTRLPGLDALRPLVIGGDLDQWRACGKATNGVGCYMQEPAGGGDTYELAARPRTLRDLNIAKPLDVVLAGDRGCVATATGVTCFIESPDDVEKIKTFSVPALAGATRLSIGSSEICGIVNGGVLCTGRPPTGSHYTAAAMHADQLGGKAVRVPNVTQAIALGGTYRQHCALGRAGSVTCWEYNRETQAVHAIAKIAGIRDGVALSAGCVLRKTGQVACFDDKSFRLDGIRDATQIAGNCVLHRDGTVSCWGSNTNGGLGDGRGTGHPWTVPVANGRRGD